MSANIFSSTALWDFNQHGHSIMLGATRQVPISSKGKVKKNTPATAGLGCGKHPNPTPKGAPFYIASGNRKPTGYFSPVRLKPADSAERMVLYRAAFTTRPAMPRFLKHFEPHALLRGAHLMTMAPVFWRRTFTLPPPEDRLFQVDPESRLLAHCHWQPGTRSGSPVIVVVHGLEGSSDSNYARGIAEAAFKKGFHAIRINQRNCGGSEELTPTLYNSGMSSDYRAVCEELANRDGLKEIFFVGYSMGGNLVLKMGGEYRESHPPALRGICAVCPALDLAACATALERWDNYFYQRHFVTALLRRYRRKAVRMPTRYPQNGFDRVRTVRQFDDLITAPNFGYRDAAEYYETASAKRVLKYLQVPTLLIIAKDDPFVPYSSILAAGAENNPCITLLAPKFGGHCAFVSNKNVSARFWAEQCVVDFCASLRT